MEAITSRDNAKVKYAARLAASAAFRAEEGLFFAEGPRLCLDLARRLPVDCLFATQKALNAWPEAEQLATALYVVEPHVAEKLGGTKSTQGMYALFQTPKSGWEQLEAGAGVLLCEAMQDPANLGAVLRSAAGLGLGGVVLAGPCADPFGPKALRASMGASGRLPLVRAEDMSAAAGRLKAAGATLYAAALTGSVPLNQAPKPAGSTGFGLMIGNEGAGLSQAAIDAADVVVRIPMENGVESLNAAAAAAVLMYALKLG